MLTEFDRVVGANLVLQVEESCQSLHRVLLEATLEVAKAKESNAKDFECKLTNLIELAKQQSN